MSIATGRLIVEVGFTGPTTGNYLHLDDPTRGRLGTAALAPDDLFVDISASVYSMACRTGATRADGPQLRYEGGTATIVLTDNERHFDPANLAGPHVVGGRTQIEPMRAVRILAEYAGAVYPLWRGFSDDWVTNYTGPNTAQTTLTCKDGFSVFAAQDRDASVGAGAGEDSGARISRILDLAGWPDADRVIATGDSTLQETTLSGNALAEMQLVQDSEMGELWIGPQGHVIYRNRLALYSDTRSNTSQATFGDDRTVGELPYEDLTPTTGAQSITNAVSIARTGGTTQAVEDAASRTAYLTRSYRRTDLLLQTDAECLDYAGALVWRLGQPDQTFTGMVVNLWSDPTLWDVAFNRQLGDRVTVIRRPPGGGDPINHDVYIRGIEHALQPDLSWKTSFVLQSATRGQFLVLDNPTLGRLDFNGLAY